MRLSSKAIIILLFIVGFVLFSFNLNNQLFWDDEDWIIGNPFVHDFSHIKELFTENILAGFGLNSNYYRPFLLLTFAFNYLIGGTDPFSYHLVSNLLHIGNAILLFVLLVRITKNNLISTFASIFFLIQPVQVEAVAYISGRGDPLSVFFMMLSLWLFDIWFRKRDGKYLWFSVGTQVVAILSRETAILLPALLALYSFSFLLRDKFWPRVIRAIKIVWPYIIVSAGYLLLRLTVLNFENTLNFYGEANDYTQHLSWRLFTFGHALFEYAKLIFYPVGLHMERDLSLHTSLFDWPVWLSAVGVMLLVLWLWRLYKKDSPAFSMMFFSFGWAAIAFLPVSGIVPINAVMYEHWLYLPMIGFATALGYAVWRFYERFKINNFMKVLGILVLCFYFIFFSVQTIRRNIVWGKPIEFYEEIMRYNPHTVRVANNLANLYSQKGELDKAEQLYTSIINGPNGDRFAQPYYNLGNIYRDRSDIDKAVELYSKAIEVDPNFPFAYQNLGAIRAGQGNLVEAAQSIEKAKILKPHDIQNHYNLGLIYNALGNKQLSLENFESALNLVRNDAERQEITARINNLKSHLE